MHTPYMEVTKDEESIVINRDNDILSGCERLTEQLAMVEVYTGYVNGGR